MTNRTCGNCSLCCTLLPVTSMQKVAGERCSKARHTGCSIYEDRPMECRLWSCRWLTGNDTADMSRPDRSRYVIDPMPDYITLQPNDGRPAVKIPVVQIWVDPNHADAWHDPKLKDFLERRGMEGKAAVVRFNSKQALCIIPPSMSSDNEWHVEQSQSEAHPIHPALKLAELERIEREQNEAIDG